MSLTSIKKSIGSLPDKSLDFIGRFVKAMERSDDREFYQSILAAQRKMMKFSHPAKIEFSQLEREDYNLPNWVENTRHFYSKSRFNQERVLVYGSKPFVLSVVFSFNDEFKRLEESGIEYTNKLDFPGYVSEDKFYSSFDAKYLYFHILEHGVESLAESIFV